MISFINSGIIPGSSTGGSTTINTFGANCLIVAASYYGHNSLSISDSVNSGAGNSWTELGPYSGGPSLSNVVIWYVPLGAVTGPNHTFTISGSAVYASAQIAAFSGVGALDVSATVDAILSSSTNSLTLGSIIPAGNNELIFSVMGTEVEPTGSSFAINDGLTLIGQTPYVSSTTSGSAIAYLIQTTAADLSPTWSWTGNTNTGVAVGIAFEASSTYTISGTAPSGTVISYSGGSSGSATASGGTFSIPVPNGTYALTASLSGYRFYPQQTVVTVNGANVTGVTLTPVAYSGNLQIVNELPNNVAAESVYSLTVGPWNLTAGNLVVVALISSANPKLATAQNAITSISDTAGNTWYIKPPCSTTTEGVGSIQFAYAYNAKGNAANTVTIGMSSGPYLSCAYMWEISGAASGDPTDILSNVCDNPNGGVGAGSATGAPFGTTQANELILGGAMAWGVNSAGLFAAGSGWALDSGTLGTSSGVFAGSMHAFTTTKQLYTQASMTYTGIPGTTISAIGTMSIKDSVPGTSVSSPIGVWQRLGVLPSFQLGQPWVIYEGNAQIISTSGSVFKLWASGYGSGLYYFESTDAITWYGYASNPVISGQGWARVYHIGSTYYCYSGLSTYPPTGGVNVYTSSDGLSWSLAKSSAIPFGNSGTWDAGAAMQMAIAGESGGTYYAYYAGYGGSSVGWACGLATSTDLINWTKSPSNPIITNGYPSAPTFASVGSEIYFWSQVVIPGYTEALVNAEPSDIGRYVSSSLTGPWTWQNGGAPSIYRVTTEEGPGGYISPNIAGQIADPCIVEANGNLYMFATASYNGATAYEVATYIAPNMTLAQLVAGGEGLLDIPIPTALSTQLPTTASDGFASSLSSQWAQLSTASGFCAAQWLSANEIGAVTTGADADTWNKSVTWYPNQWAQVTVKACTGSSVGVSLRQNMSGQATAYRFYWTGTAGTSGTFYIDLVNSGVVTHLVSGSTTVNLGDTLTGVVIANNLTFYQNGLLLAAVVQDSTIASGAAGFTVNAASSTANAAIGSFVGGSFLTIPPTPPTPTTVLPIGPTSVWTSDMITDQRDYYHFVLPNGRIVAWIDRTGTLQTSGLPTSSAAFVIVGDGINDFIEWTRDYGGSKIAVAWITGAGVFVTQGNGNPTPGPFTKIKTAAKSYNPMTDPYPEAFTNSTSFDIGVNPVGAIQ